MMIMLIIVYVVEMCS